MNGSLAKAPSELSLLTAAIRTLHPSILGTLAVDLLRLPGRPSGSRRSLDGAISWLCTAHDQCERRGVSAGFSLKRGWLPPYPETTGYIIPTMLDYATLSNREEYIDRAIRMGEWECDVQMTNGAVQGGVYRGCNEERIPVAFNTGQVILGWVRLLDYPGRDRYADSITRAADWLVSTQSADGSWRLPGAETSTVVHAYDARTGWSLIEAGKALDNDNYIEAGKKNIEWTLTQESDSNWYRNNAFFSGTRMSMTFTHTISYVMEGLLGAWQIVRDDRYLEAAQRTAHKLLRIFEVRRFLAGDFDENWQSGKDYSCLTGSSQIAAVWLWIYMYNDDARYLNAALKLNDFVKATQNTEALHPGVRGAIKGSQPIWGSYSAFAYPNWAAKFFADSLMLELEAMDNFEKKTFDEKATDEDVK